MNGRSQVSRSRFAVFAAVTLLYNIPVILWGAYVRVSFSGDGCGANWPTCGGQFIPQKMAAPTLIEYTHRLMTSLDTALVLVLLAWAFLAFPRKHAVRRYSVLSLVFLFIEALLGAGLVLLRLVARDQSVGRVWYLSAHLTNTMLLLAALTATAWLAATGSERLRLRELRSPLFGALLVTIFISVTGTIVALGDTLFPATSFSAGLRQDFTSASSLLLRLRIIHPLLAIAGAAYIVWIAFGILRTSDEQSQAHRAAIRVIGITVFQLAIGAMNLSLLAPLWLQLVHLLMADLVWIAVVLLALETVKVRATRAALAYV